MLERIRIIAILVSPFLPSTSERIFAQLGIKPEGLKSRRFRRLAGKLKKGNYLFQKVEV